MPFSPPPLITSCITLFLKRLNISFFYIAKNTVRKIFWFYSFFIPVILLIISPKLIILKYVSMSRIDLINRISQIFI